MLTPLRLATLGFGCVRLVAKTKGLMSWTAAASSILVVVLDGYHDRTVPAVVDAKLLSGWPARLLCGVGAAREAIVPAPGAVSDAVRLLPSKRYKNIWLFMPCFYDRKRVGLVLRLFEARGRYRRTRVSLKLYRLQRNVVGRGYS